jgi:hypothetical protein
MNKNVLIGVGLIGAGLFLAKRAADNGKIVPVLSKVFPPKPQSAPSTASFSGMSAAESWNA